MTTRKPRYRVVIEQFPGIGWDWAIDPTRNRGHREKVCEGVHVYESKRAAKAAARRLLAAMGLGPAAAEGAA